MAALVATLPMQLVCQLIIAGSPVGITKNETFVPIATPTPSSPQTETSVLPEGYIAYPDIGVAYKTYQESVSWKVARKRCISEGANLAVIDSAKKIAYVISQRKSSSSAHVGIHSLFDDGEWVSVKTGFAISDIPWGPYQLPMNYRCAMVMLDGSGLRSLHCDGICHEFVCEIAIPDTYKAEITTPLPVQISAN